MADRLDEDLARLSVELSLARAEDVAMVSGRLDALLDRGVFDNDTLFRLLDRREQTFDSPTSRHFGRLAVEGGFVTHAQLDAALREQRGTGLQLGQVLQKSGHLKLDQVLEILRRQDKHVIACPCGKRYLIESPKPDMQYRCGRCGRDLEPPDPTALPPGTRVGRYEIEREIGRGRTGIVYRAKGGIALKVLAGHDAERFRREAGAVAKLRHPNIVNVHGAGEADGRAFVAMDLLDGATMDRANLQRREAVEAIMHVARAIAHAHEQGVAHRDLRPRNVIVQRTPAGIFPFVLDFAVPPPGAPTDTASDHAALATMLAPYAAGDRTLEDLASKPPASARVFADDLRVWLSETRRRYRTPP